MNVIRKKLPIMTLSILICTLALTACGSNEATQKVEPKPEKSQDALNKSVNNLKDKANLAIASSEKHNKQLEENSQ